ncbi:MAG: hypothetical protein AAGI38_03360, partial [Bacteroidota bacterium]
MKIANKVLAFQVILVYLLHSGCEEIHWSPKKAPHENDLSEKIPKSTPYHHPIKIQYDHENLKLHLDDAVDDSTSKIDW